MSVNILSIITNLFLYSLLLFATNILLDKFVLAIPISPTPDCSPLGGGLYEWFQTTVSPCSLVTSYV